MRLLNLRQIKPQHVRLYSNNYQPQKIRISSVIVDNNQPKRYNTLLENKDYPFPGAVTHEVLSPSLVKNRITNGPRAVYYTLNLAQISNILSFPVIKSESYEPNPTVKQLCRWNVKIELVALKCPLLLKKDLLKLFPNADIKKSQLTLINLMEIVEDIETGKDENVNIRDKVDSFLLAAQSICATLKNYGFWADFVDPYNNNSRLDTNSYKRLMNQNEDFSFTGIKVNENDGCKTIEQVSLQHSPFIGTVFTNANQYSSAVKQIINSGD